jgi:hypothetical protein
VAKIETHMKGFGNAIAPALWPELRAQSTTRDLFAGLGKAFGDRSTSWSSYGLGIKALLSAGLSLPLSPIVDI